MFTAINVCGFADLKFNFFLKLDESYKCLRAINVCEFAKNKLYTVNEEMFTAINVCGLVEKFNFFLKLDESYKCLRAINVCEFATNAKFANIYCA